MKTIIDLSVPLRNYSFDPSPQRIYYYDHVERGRHMAQTNGFEIADMHPDAGIGGSNEDVSLSSHAGTHVDAPYHYGPHVGGVISKTIDEVPLEWCYGDGVLLDFSDRAAGYVISVEDVRDALDAIHYTLKAEDIVLIRTGADKRLNQRDYFENQCGLGADSFEWLLDRGIRTFGTDGFTIDTSWPHMVAALKSGNKSAFFPVTYQVGRRREHIRAQKLGNLYRLPRPFGFKVAMFPVKIERGSGSWARVVAILDEDEPDLS